MSGAIAVVLALLGLYSSISTPAVLAQESSTTVEEAESRQPAVDAVDTDAQRTQERIDTHVRLLVWMGVAVLGAVAAFTWHTSPRRRVRIEAKAAERAERRRTERRSEMSRRVDEPIVPTGAVDGLVRPPRLSPEAPPSINDDRRVVGDRRLPAEQDRRSSSAPLPPPPARRAPNR